MSFEPELGQAVFSNDEWYEHELEEHVEAGIALLGSLVTAKVEGGGYNPTCNHGPTNNIEDGVFELRAYCWCDGEGEHEDGCPPNFKYGDFEVRWYKHLGRGSSQSRVMPVAEWHGIMTECLRALGEPV